MMRWDESTMRWLRDEALEAEDMALAFTVERGIAGDELARQEGLVALGTRVGRAYRAHCRAGSGTEG